MVATLSTVLHDALAVLGVAAALAVGLLFVNLGLLLPGLLTWLDGHHGGGPAGPIEPGPGNPSIVTEPAGPRSFRLADAAAGPVLFRSETHAG